MVGETDDREERDSDGATSDTGTAHKGNPTILEAVKAVAAQLITLQNSVDSLIASSQPGRTPYQVVVRSTAGQPNPVLPPVPAGKRLVITTVSVRTFIVGQALGMMKLQFASGWSSFSR